MASAPVATLSQFVAPLAILVPFALVRLLRGKPTGVAQFRSGLLIGAAVALYLESLLLTDVARALILFYAMPAWGKILAVVVMRRPLMRWRLVSLLLSVAGMLIILGAGRLSLSMNIGDLMALLSGVLFAFGAVLVRQAPETSIFERILGFFLYGSVAALVLSLLPLAALGEARPSPSWPRSRHGSCWPPPAPDPGDVGDLLGPRNVDPGRLGILLQIEAVMGIASAALLAGEPFGAPPAIGAARVIGAGLVEVIGNGLAAPAETDAGCTFMSCLRVGSVPGCGFLGRTRVAHGCLRSALT